jgi:hypothetical protein
MNMFLFLGHLSVYPPYLIFKATSVFSSHSLRDIWWHKKGSYVIGYFGQCLAFPESHIGQIILRSTVYDLKEF